MRSSSTIARDQDFAAVTGQHFPLVAAALVAFALTDVVCVVAMLFNL